MWIVPLLATVISLFFAFIFTSKFMKSKRFPTLLYAISMYLYAIGSFANFFGAAFDWYVWTYKLFYGVGVSLVGYLAAATVYNKFKPIVGHVFLAYVAVITVLLLVALIPAQVNQSYLDQAGFAVENAAMADSVRQYSFPLSGVGGIALIVVAIWSWWSSRLEGNLWIAGGAILMSLIGRLATMDLSSWLVPFKELIGIIVIFYGVMLLDKGKLFLPRRIGLAVAEAAATATPKVNKEKSLQVLLNPKNLPKLKVFLNLNKYITPLTQKLVNKNNDSKDKDQKTVVQLKPVKNQNTVNPQNKKTNNNSKSKPKSRPKK